MDPSFAHESDHLEELVGELLGRGDHQLRQALVEHIERALVNEQRDVVLLLLFLLVVVRERVTLPRLFELVTP